MKRLHLYILYDLHLLCTNSVIPIKCNNHVDKCMLRVVNKNTNHTTDCNHHCTIKKLFCNWPLFKYTSFKTKYFLVSYDWAVTTCLVWAIYWINHSRDFWKFWNYPSFIRVISKFSKIQSVDLSQITFPYMWLLVLI